MDERRRREEGTGTNRVGEITLETFSPTLWLKFRTTLTIKSVGL